MPRKSRDYAAEYRRRVERGRLLGYSRAVARGHPRKHEVSIKQSKVLSTLLNVTIKPDAKVVKGGGPTVTGLTVDQKKERTTQEEFIAAMMEEGFSERDSYTLWFY